MRDSYAVTVSDITGTRYFTVKKTIKRNVIVSCLLAAGVIVGSAYYNFLQSQQNQQLRQSTGNLEQELAVVKARSIILDNKLETQQGLLKVVNAELVEIERISGVEVSDGDQSMAQRIASVGDFYKKKDQQYNVIGSRVEQIEGIIGLDTAQVSAESELAERVDLATLSASQKRILHDNIPNGFPTSAKKITSEYGYRIHPITKKKSFHKGVDLRAKGKEGVVATADGIVREATYSKLSGNRVVVQHNFGFETRYSHLSKMLVSVGDVVNKDDIIGRSGTTGLSSAEHLHYEVRYLGKTIDPKQFLYWEFGSNSLFDNVRNVQWVSLINLINKQITPQTLQLSLLDRNSPDN